MRPYWNIQSLWMESSSTQEPFSSSAPWKRCSFFLKKKWTGATSIHLVTSAVRNKIESLSLWLGIQHVHTRNNIVLVRVCIRSDFAMLSSPESEEKVQETGFSRVPNHKPRSTFSFKHVSLLRSLLHPMMSKKWVVGGGSHYIVDLGNKTCSCVWTTTLLSLAPEKNQNVPLTGGVWWQING